MCTFKKKSVTKNHGHFGLKHFSKLNMLININFLEQVYNKEVIYLIYLFLFFHVQAFNRRLYTFNFLYILHLNFDGQFVSLANQTTIPNLIMIIDLKFKKYSNAPSNVLL